MAALDEAAWSAADPRALGVDPALGARLDAAHAAGELGGLHAVAVLRHGRPVLERYWPGLDERWGQPLGEVAHGPGTLHDLRSVSKSLVSLLYGIALEKGLVPPPESPLLEAFPGLEDLATDPRRRDWQVRHLLAMTLGIAWNEDLPYDDPRNSEIRMEMAPDRVRFVLEQPIERPAGEAWRYSGGTTALLGRLISAGSGQSLDDFARERLFAPLGIEAWDWTRGSDGQPAAASGCRATARGLLRIGAMVLAGGRWAGRPGAGRQVVPAAWLAEALAPQVACEEGLSYGYQWFLSGPAGLRWMAAFGNGGQRLQLFPPLGLAVAVLAGNYNRADGFELPLAVMTRFVLPALQGP